MTGRPSGAPEYQAPEVTSGSPQSYSSDNEVLNKCVIKLREVLVSMSLSPNWEDRPECKDVLKTYLEWAIHEKYVAKDLMSLIPILWQNMKRLNNSEFFVKYFIANFGEDIIKTIKIFHVFDDEYGCNVLIVTNDDKPFVLAINDKNCIYIWSQPLGPRK
ncbi:unnamed protein product [Oppiella nova]|uniref:Uncharacterized protein n=1 Tax=Oppiella nova TaxID=334625 RepID=A0A7R9ML70_9ACAR|nr:unnamed protein product [Oppiella nova]CAG2179403.1 unnamed protein product [Oppiella nova]